jgi:hypothetical protein
VTGNTCSAGVKTTGAGNCIAAIACGPANKTIADTNNPKRRIVCIAITFPLRSPTGDEMRQIRIFQNSAGYRVDCLSTGSEKGNGP